ncbi:MAG: HlyD family efflux transporter periplasmic adaptor subunit [Marinilabiliales bacterium]|nr:MAG: HlyD family efflux transporter periplasmic adaptor subunit [Marinilabiliales bacterium]
MKKNVIITTSIIGAMVLGVIIYAIAGDKENIAMLEVPVMKGRFEVLVTVTGELQAERSEQIMGPPELRSRNLRIGNIRIQDLIPEGTVVDSGDYVALLDRSESDNTLKDMEDALERAEAQFTRTQLDTTITLSNLRDELINLHYTVEERRLTLEQSKFEPPATIRQAEINLDRAERGLEQAKQNYQLRIQQAREDMNEASINLAQQRRRYQEMLDVLEKFEIRAPKSGMVIYHREWSGQRRTVGSNISPWDLTVATLPDLSSMLSRTYVNEIDVSKVRAGQRVRVGVDAFPERAYTGEIISVANVGEQLPNTDARVFEVLIRINEYDPILRPAMTTSNIIITQTFDDVHYIPLEAINLSDSIPIVYKRDGTKQIVVLGSANENHVIVEHGLTENERIYLTIPENPDRYRLVGEDLIAVIQEKRERQREEEQARRQEEERVLRERENRMRQMRQPGAGAAGAGAGMQTTRPGN